MKKTYSFYCRAVHRGVVALLLLTVSVVAKAYDFREGNADGVTIYYNILSDSEASVTYGGTSYNSALYSGAVFVPETVTHNGTTYSVTDIGYSAFESCTGLTQVTIPNSVTSIGNYAFDICSGLTEITIPNSVTTICQGAFYGCTGLTGELTIPNSVTEMGREAFRYCTGLTSVTIPESVTSIGSGAFREGTGLTQFDVAEANEYYCSVDGVLFTKDMTTLIQFPAASSMTSYDIPESVTSIDNYAFNYCIGLTEITIPESVTSIGTDAFRECTGLTSITIPNSVTTIAWGTFMDCTGLTNVTIGNGVTSIGGWVFYGCTGLTSVTIGNSLATISSRAFYNCTGLTSIYSLNPEPPICYSDNYGVFYNVDTSTCTLYVPEGTKEAYSTADQWKDFLNIVDNQPNAIDDITINGNDGANGGNREIVGYYTTDGEQVPALQRGINIIRYSDGTARKVLLK